MKNLKFLSLFASMLFFEISGCSNQNTIGFEECDCPSPSTYEQSSSLNCTYYSFLEGVSMQLKNSNTYVIRGKVLNPWCEYGLKIRLVKDFKGNFPKNVSTFIAWGGDGNGWRDKLKGCKGELILHLGGIDVPEETSCEKQGDYSTLFCTSSFLFVSGNVTGFILPDINSMPWIIFQERLNKVLKNE